MAIGITEMLVLLVIILIVFGAGKLPKVMGDLGKGLKAFKTGMAEAAAGREATEAQVPTPATAAATPSLPTSEVRMAPTMPTPGNAPRD